MLVLFVGVTLASLPLNLTLPLRKACQNHIVAGSAAPWFVWAMPRCFLQDVIPHFLQSPRHGKMVKSSSADAHLMIKSVDFLEASDLGFQDLHFLLTRVTTAVMVS